MLASLYIPALPIQYFKRIDNLFHIYKLYGIIFLSLLVRYLQREFTKVNIE